MILCPPSQVPDFESKCGIYFVSMEYKEPMQQHSRMFSQSCMFSNEYCNQSSASFQNHSAPTLPVNMPLYLIIHCHGMGFTQTMTETEACKNWIIFIILILNSCDMLRGLMTLQFAYFISKQSCKLAARAVDPLVCLFSCLNKLYGIIHCCEG